MTAKEFIEKIDTLRENILKYDDEPDIHLGYTKNDVTYIKDFEFEVRENFSKNDDIFIIVNTNE
ncbi:hypothetical protein K4L44_03745 [Halosquirtibacter laminarini]|uniref:Uncharacterized protein n=1 Tax=Halosquirtibacter laminarini TaxID=3374600 RepID=A0AC61NH22_9BACT|nr:hypothetical protein K4L44_03745 [Prolixibacteraceae bacterium]